jgi:hypothetical protein
MKTLNRYILSGVMSKQYHKCIAALLVFVFMQATFVLSQTAASFSCKEKKKKTHARYHFAGSLKEYTVFGKVTQTSPYCGGAKPPKELLDQLATPVAYPNKKFYIRLGKTNNAKASIIKSFTADSAGSFSIRLVPGTYSIILEEQVHKMKASNYTKKYELADNKCLQEWWAKPYYLLEVKNKNIEELNFVFHHRCYLSSDIPCITYIGPVHP